MTAELVAVLVTSVLVGCSAASESGPQNVPLDPADTLVAFSGDFYTLGTGASDPRLSWSTVVSEQRDWVEFNPSINSLGFISNRRVFAAGDLPDLVIAQRPDIVFVTMGLNDNFSFGSAGERNRQ